MSDKKKIKPVSAPQVTAGDIQNRIAEVNKSLEAGDRILEEFLQTSWLTPMHQRAGRPSRVKQANSLHTESSVLVDAN